jgi:hypothetical protein
MIRSNRTTTTVALALGLAFTLTSCASSAPLTQQDAAALQNLGEVAGPTSNVDAESITRTECWLPSEHLVDAAGASNTTWRVLCRAHYVDASGDRYQDTTCVGDFATTPMLDHCYRWAYYTGMPSYEDYAGVPTE